MTEKNESDHRALRSLVEQNIRTDTQRLNKHSAEIDDNRERVAKIEEWKDQFQKQVAQPDRYLAERFTAIAAVADSISLERSFFTSSGVGLMDAKFKKIQITPVKFDNERRIYSEKNSPRLCLKLRWTLPGIEPQGKLKNYVTQNSTKNGFRCERSVKFA